MNDLVTRVAVIGAGHAGIEAALASARMGVDTVLFTTNLDAVANLPCNPSIGGSAKGHLVFEIDALGGEMGRAADLATIQSRTLNLGKGAAVHSKRVQADRAEYMLYCYPDKITDELIAELRDNPRLVKYMDIPVQHIADPVLKRMNRHGDGALIRETVRRLRESVPDITLRTTAMVGFPGETEEDFAELCEFIKEARFERFGAFTYSAEEDTPAAEMDGQIDEQLKQDRYDILMQTQLTVVEEQTAALVGREMTVLCDGYDAVAEIYFGRSEADAPDVDAKVYFKAKRGSVRSGEFVRVHIDEAIDYDLIGSLVK